MRDGRGGEWGVRDRRKGTAEYGVIRPWNRHLPLRVAWRYGGLRAVVGVLWARWPF